MNYVLIVAIRSITIVTQVSVVIKFL